MAPSDTGSGATALSRITHRASHHKPCKATARPEANDWPDAEIPEEPFRGDCRADSKVESTSSSPVRTDDTESQAESHSLSLPAAVRNAIYEFILVHDEPILPRGIAAIASTQTLLDHVPLIQALPTISNRERPTLMDAAKFFAGLLDHHINLLSRMYGLVGDDCRGCVVQGFIFADICVVMRVLISGGDV